MTTIEERVSRLEGAYEHLATKADVQEVRIEIQKLKSDLTLRLGALIIAHAGVTIAILKFLE